MIYVIATVTVATGRRDEFLDEFRRLVPEVLAEPGCLFYGPTVDAITGLAKQIPVRQDVVTIVEGWESLEHLQGHLHAPHMTSYRERVSGLVVSSELQVLTPQ